MAKRNSHKRLSPKIIRQLLKPLVRILLRRQVAFQEFLTLSKEVFVEIAREEILRSTQKINTSRIAALTGLDRKHVTSILHNCDASHDPEPTSVLARVIAQWTHNENFLTTVGSPRVLCFKGESSEFRQLVRTVSQALNPGTILFELKRANLVELTDAGIRLKHEVAWCGPDIERGLRILARDFELMAQAVEENLTTDQPIPHLHMRTEYDNVFLADLPMIRKWFAKQGDAFHKRARRYLSKYDKDLHPSTESDDRAGGFVALGGFSITIPSKQTLGATQGD